MSRFGLTTALVFSTTTFANVADPTADGSLLTRSVVDQLVEQGRFNSEAVIEVTPESFVKLQRRALRALPKRQAFLPELLYTAPAVFVCTVALCMGLARSHAQSNKSHVDPNLDIAPPAGGW